MSALTLRRVGSSHLIEGFPNARGIDPERLHHALRSQHGDAVAIMGTPKPKPKPKTKTDSNLKLDWDELCENDRIDVGDGDDVDDDLEDWKPAAQKSTIDALIIDRKAITWQKLREWLADFVASEARTTIPPRWTDIEDPENQGAGPTAILEF